MIVSYLATQSGEGNSQARSSLRKPTSPTYRFQQDKGLSQQIAQEVVVSQSDAFKVSGRIDLMKQL